MKYVLCVYDCVRARVCMCVCVANGCTCMFIALAAKGLNLIKFQLLTFEGVPFSLSFDLFKLMNY